jgi:SRSO17 transposase
MKPEQIEQCADELVEFHKRLAPLFYEKRQAHWCSKWLHGLLLDGVRKNATGLARAVPDANVQAMQQFLTDSTWEAGPLIGRLQAMAQEVLGEPDGILVCDDTGFPKKGTESVGVARQYSGTLRKVDNC